MSQTSSNFVFRMDIDSPASLNVLFEHFGEPLCLINLEATKDWIEYIIAKHFAHPQKVMSQYHEYMKAHPEFMRFLKSKVTF